MRIVTGRLADLLSSPEPQFSWDDYLCAHLTDTDPVLDPMARLREVYRNMKQLQFAQPAAGAGAAREAGDYRRRQPEDFFRAFYRDIVDAEISDEALDAFRQVGIRLDAIFVDEGFGALDPEALDFAIRTLKDLQQARRTVGIISHVAELKGLDRCLPDQTGCEAVFVI